MSIFCYFSFQHCTIRSLTILILDGGIEEVKRFSKLYTGATVERHWLASFRQDDCLGGGEKPAEPQERHGEFFAAQGLGQ